MANGRSLPEQTHLISPPLLRLHRQHEVEVLSVPDLLQVSQISSEHKSPFLLYARLPSVKL